MNSSTKIYIAGHRCKMGSAVLALSKANNKLGWVSELNLASLVKDMRKGARLFHLNFF